MLLLSCQSINCLYFLWQGFFSVIIYKAQILFIVQWEHACSNDFLWFARYLVVYESITARSSLNVQYGHIPCGISLLLNGHPCMMYSFSCCRWSFWCVACCISCMDMHSSMSVSVCTMSVLSLMPSISSSLSSVWFARLASQLWKGLVQACRLSSFFISEFSAICIAVLTKSNYVILEDSYKWLVVQIILTFLTKQ